jgi:small subunit ribosomal protein S4
LGDPKKARKKFSRPRSPWRADQLAQELYLLGTFGLRNKRELWRAQTQLSSVRKQARILLAATQAVREREEKKLLDSLHKKGLIGEGATLDDILSLTVEDMLARRLQSMVFKRGMALSPLHSRQLIVHGHVAVGERIITIPGYEVGAAQEGVIKLVGGAARESSASAEASQSEQKQRAEQLPAEQRAEVK